MDRVQSESKTVIAAPRRKRNETQVERARAAAAAVDPEVAQKQTTRARTTQPKWKANDENIVNAASNPSMLVASVSAPNRSVPGVPQRDSPRPVRLASLFATSHGLKRRSDSQAARDAVQSVRRASEHAPRPLADDDDRARTTRRRSDGTLVQLLVVRILALTQDSQQPDWTRCS